MPDQKINRVYNVDDEQLVRMTVADMLRDSGYDIVSFASGEHFLEVADELAPGCVLMDVNMPEMDGLTVLKTLAEKEYRLPIIMMSGYGDIPMAVDAMKVGAVSFIEKPFKPGALRELVTETLEAAEETRDFAANHQAAGMISALTRRELEVLKLLLKGQQNKQIAQSLGISHRTVETHRANMMKRAGVNTVAELAKLAADAGL